MTIQLPIVEFSEEQRELWKRVTDLWALSKERNAGQISSTLHPDYVGWDMTAPLPHDRDAAVLSVSGDSPELREYELQPFTLAADRSHCVCPAGKKLYSSGSSTAWCTTSRSWRIMGMRTEQTPRHTAHGRRAGHKQGSTIMTSSA